MEDLENIFALSNDPFVRKYSLSTSTIRWDEHAAWFESTLKDPDMLFYVSHDSNHNLIGQVRFQITQDKAIISISISESFRGKKLALPLIEDTIQLLFKNRINIKQIIAFIKPDNPVSLKLFLNAGFKDSGYDQIKGNEVKKLIRNK